jgi:hypothetical protein
VLGAEESVFDSYRTLNNANTNTGGKKIKVGGIVSTMDTFHYDSGLNYAEFNNHRRTYYIDCDEKAVLYRWDLMRALCCKTYYVSYSFIFINNILHAVINRTLTGVSADPEKGFHEKSVSFVLLHRFRGI